MENIYVLGTVFVAAVGTLLAGLQIGSINGMFEMHGFQSTFSELFEVSNNCSYGNDTGLYSESESVTAACGVCTATRNCGGSRGLEASSILGLIVSIGNFGASLGAFLGGWPSTVIGRRATLSISGLIMAVGGLLSAASFHSWLFMIGRGLSGLSMGVSYGLVALYISEVSPKKSRGRLASIVGPVYGAASMAQFGATCGFSQFCIGWRISLLLQVVGGLAYAILMLLLPKTPRWLVLHGRISEARVVLSRINNSPVTTMQELEELKATTNELSKNYFKNLRSQFSQTVKWKYFKRLILVSVLFILTPLMGNFTYYFGSTFFCKLNISPCLYNTILGASLLIGGISTSVFMDNAGRKILLLAGSLTMAIIEALIAVLVQVFNLEEEENYTVGYVLTGLFCAFAVTYAASWITTPWVISSEVFPVETRGLKVAISTGIFWASAALSTQITPIVINSALGISGYMCLLVGLTILSFIIVLLGLPETKKVSLEEMDKLFDKPWAKRVNLVLGTSGIVRKRSNLPEVEKVNLDNELEKSGRL